MSKVEMFELQGPEFKNGIFYGVRNIKTGTTHLRAVGQLTLEDYDQFNEWDKQDQAYFGSYSFESIHKIKPYKDGFQYFLALRIKGTLTAKLVRKLYGFNDEGE